MRTVRTLERNTPSGLWISVFTIAMLALGFRPQRFAGARFADDRFEPHNSNRTQIEASRCPERAVARQGVTGWSEVLSRLYRDIGTDRVVSLAAGVSFYSILAIFPAIAALVALYGLFADPQSITKHLDTLAGILPGGALQVVGDEMRRIAAQGSKTLGPAFIIGLLTALWSANAGMKALFDALNIVYKEPEMRSFIALNSVSLLFTVGIIALVLLVIGALVVLPIGTQLFGLARDSEQILRFSRWPALLLIVMFGLALLYRFGPNRSNPHWRWITWGTAFAGIGWLAVSVLFTWYAANFGSYNKTYGSLGAMIGFMVWIWLSSIIILLGAELDFAMERMIVRRPYVDRAFADQVH